MVLMLKKKSKKANSADENKLGKMCTYINNGVEKMYSNVSGGANDIQNWIDVSVKSIEESSNEIIAVEIPSTLE